MSEEIKSNALTDEEVAQAAGGILAPGKIVGSANNNPQSVPACRHYSKSGKTACDGECKYKTKEAIPGLGFYVCSL